MVKKITNTEIIANELLIEKYRPLMVIKLSKPTTLRVGSNLEKFALDISDKSGYEVLLFPEEDKTEIEIVSVCNSKFVEVEDIKNYIYEKYENKLLDNSPYTRAKDFIKNKNK
jgi:hypothetical protein|tara:strand:+ start:703 stop:1041 length:339 start_codon:yes stop_codon:yes gene_type:complete